jgi:hypothetical protein
MKKKQQTTPANRRKAAEDRVVELNAKAEAIKLEHAISLMESPQPVRVPWSDYPAYDTWGMGSSAYQRPYVWTSPEDRTEGRYRPFYENAFEVRRQRAESRALMGLFPIARGALQKLSDYVMGTGWDFTVQPVKSYKNSQMAIQAATIVQGVVDKFLEYNRFIGDLDREIHEGSRVDGDALPTLYPEDNQVRVELTDPSFILEPLNPRPLEQYLRTSHKLNGWWHGVHTTFNPQLKRDDVWRPLGYHAVYDQNGDQWDYLPAHRVEQIKRTVGRGARVGVNDFLTVMEDLRNEAKLRRNTAVGGAILAAIVMIEQFPEGVSSERVGELTAANKTYTREKPTQYGSQSMSVETTSPGTVKRVSAGRTATTGPLGTLRSPVYIEIAQYLLRIIGTPWSMPEYLVSGDASNANYASSLVSESPFIKYCEHEQAFYASHFERLIWKALKMYHEMGAFGNLSWQVICSCLEVTAEYSSPATRDKQQQADVDGKLNDLGIKSKRSIAADFDLDYDEEKQHIDSEPKQPQAVQPFAPFSGNRTRNPDGDGDGIYPEARTQSLAVRAMDLLMERSDALPDSSEFIEGEGRWITLDNGTHVKIDDDGEIADEISQLGKGKADSGGEKPKAGDERGATAVFQGKKHRTVSKRARINVDQAADLLKDRGYKMGRPVFDMTSGQTLYPISKGGKTFSLPAKTIQAFLSTEQDDINA